MAFDALYLEHAAPLQTARRLTLRTTAEQVTQGLLQVRLAEPVPRLGELARAHILAGAGPVSYTHLDVYKRQAEYRG